MGVAAAAVACKRLGSPTGTVDVSNKTNIGMVGDPSTTAGNPVPDAK